MAPKSSQAARRANAKAKARAKAATTPPVCERMMPHCDMLQGVVSDHECYTDEDESIAGEDESIPGAKQSPAATPL